MKIYIDVLGFIDEQGGTKSHLGDIAVSILKTCIDENREPTFLEGQQFPSTSDSLPEQILFRAVINEYSETHLRHEMQRMRHFQNM